MCKVSIIIPIYNVEKYLDKCVQSAINQTLQDIEIILVDDESPDSCPQMCDDFAKKDSRIKVLHRNNGGLGFARNSGIDVATGEYVTFLDSDDFVDLNTYEHLYNIAKTNSLDAIYYNFKRFTCENEVQPGIATTDIKTYKGDGIKELMLDIIASEPEAKVDHKIQCSSCTAMYRMDIIKKNNVRFHSERELISEDLILNLDFLKHAKSVAFNSGEYYHYRVNPTSLSSTVRTDRIEKNYTLYTYIKEHLKYWGIDEVQGEERNARLFIGYSRSSIIQLLQSDICMNNKIIWLKKQLKYPAWHEIGTTYKWEKLPLFQRVIFRACYKKDILYLIIISYLKKIL